MVAGSVHVTCEFMGHKLTTESKPHAPNIDFNFSTLLYIDNVEKCRSFFETEPVTLIIHDRDPKEWRKTISVDFWLNSLLLDNSKELKQVGSVYRYEMEAPPQQVPQDNSPSKKKPSSRPSTAKKGQAKKLSKTDEVDENTDVVP